MADVCDKWKGMRTLTSATCDRFRSAATNSKISDTESIAVHNIAVLTIIEENLC